MTSVKSAAGSLPLLLTAAGGCAMSMVDTNMIAVAVPSVTRAFGADPLAGQWVISAFFLSFAASLMAAGAIADRFGRRRTYLSGLWALAMTSTLSGLAGNLFLLQVSRFAQGMAMAFVLAPALAMIGQRFRSPAEATRAWLIWGAIMGGTTALSPLLGGWLVETFGWRAGFLVNVPLCTALILATLRYSHESYGERERRLDLPGILLFAAAMFAMAWALINGQAHGWLHPATLAGAAGGILALAGFGLAEKMQLSPMIPLALFTDRNFIGAVFGMFAYAATAQVMASLLPIFLQYQAGLTAGEAGRTMLPFALAMLAFPFVGAWLGRRFLSRTVLVFGFLIVAAGNFLAAWGAFICDWPLLLSGFAVLGSGAGILNSESQKAIMATIPASHSGIASGISTTTRFTGILLGFAGLNALASGARSIVADGHRTGPAPGLAVDPEMLAFSMTFLAAGLFAAVSASLLLLLLHRDGVRSRT